MQNNIFGLIKIYSKKLMKEVQECKSIDFHCQSECTVCNNIPNQIIERRECT